MMVVNGLSDPTGSAADCAQQIKLTFDFSSNPKVTGITLLDPKTGQLKDAPLNAIKSRKQLVLDLVGGGAALFGAAGVGDDAEAAEFVAAFLDGQKRGDALWRGLFRQEIEFVFRREIGFDHRAAGPRRFGNHLRQTMVRARTQNDIDIGRAGEDLFTLGLRHAAGDRQDHAIAGGFLQPA